MSQRHNTQVIGHLLEASEGVDAIDNNSPGYYFGTLTKTFGEMPQYENVYVPYYAGNAIEPSELVLVDQKVSETISFALTNGVPLFYLMGEAAVLTSVYTLSYKAVPTTFTTKWQTNYTGGTAIQRSIKACHVASCVFNFDYQRVGSPTTFGVNIEGRLYAVSTYVATQVNPVHAVTGSQVEDKIFRHKVDSTNERVTWDFGGSAEELINSVLKITIESKRDNIWTKYSNNTTSSFLEPDKVPPHAFTAIVLRNDETAFLTDYEAGDQTTDFYIKQYSSPAGVDNTYLEFELEDVSITQCKPNHALIENNEIPIWSIVGQSPTFIPKFKDGVAAGLYEL